MTARWLTCHHCRRSIAPYHIGYRSYGGNDYCSAACETAAIQDEYQHGTTTGQLCIRAGCRNLRAGRHGLCQGHRAEYLREWRAARRAGQRTVTA